jgi:hypothetical protein
LKAGQDVRQTVSDLAARLQQLTQQREHAEREVAKFDKKHEPDSVIQQRIEERVEAERETARKERVKPHVEEFAKQFRAFRVAVDYLRSLPGRMDRGEVEFGNPVYIKEMCHVLTRNLMTNDVSYKPLLEGGGGWDAYEGMVDRMLSYTSAKAPPSKR